jgi:hypothetical protein
LLALAGRLASGMVVADAAAVRNAEALLVAMIQCQDAPAAPNEPSPKPVRHAVDHGLCVVATGLDLPCPTLASAVLVPPPRCGIRITLARVPPARGPPAIPPGAALPRGPPILA